MDTVQNGKGRSPEKGRDLHKFRDNYDEIDWGRSIEFDALFHVVSSIEDEKEPQSTGGQS